jgi:nucleotide-binding universal stress UspA family protein
LFLRGPHIFIAKKITNKTMKTAALKTTFNRTRTTPVARTKASGIGIKDILVPTDFSDASREALLEARKFAEKFGARLTLLYVVEPPVYPEIIYAPLITESEQIVSACQEKLNQITRQNRIPPRLIQQTLVRTGSPALEIADAARTLKVDLIVISTHGRSGLARAFMGSTAERVVRHAPCPVLVVRPTEANPFARKN